MALSCISTLGRVLIACSVLLWGACDRSREKAVSRPIWAHPQTIRVAAVQMEAELGEVDRNLERAERLVRRAFEQSAQWVILPEFFTSAIAFHPKMLDAARPADGRPLDLLVSLAREYQGVVGGEGVILADIEAGLLWTPTAPISGWQWIQALPEWFVTKWEREGALGAQYYRSTTLPRLRTQGDAQ
ncbi:MAG TPA: carbon-nitrogen hydrolase family protein [Bryobacterales bacterium]|nr:carbon-nitrogen hydrolase family protein [Bryobacterales bacterium]